MTILVSILALLIIFGFPIAFAIGIATLAAFLIHSMPLVMIAQRMFEGINSYVLLAIPLFMFAGELMNSGGLSQKIVEFAESIVGSLPGGIAITAILASMLFAGISGSAAADTAAIGLIMIPAMKKNGYPAPLAAATVASAGSMGVIIPPSIPMIIYGFITGVSVGKLFIAGIVPGVLIGISLAITAAFISPNNSAHSKKRFSFMQAAKSFKESILAIGAPVIVIGGILAGIFTATESAAIAVAYSFVVGKFVYKKLTWKSTFYAAKSGAIMSSVILLIISFATVFSWYLSINNIPHLIYNFISSIATGKIMIILIINLFLLIMGTFVETAASIILFTPIVTPILLSTGINPLTVGVIVVTNLSIGMLTPPLGINLIVSAPIAESSMLQISRAAVPFLIVMICDLMAISFFAPLTTFLPAIMK